MRQKGKKVRMLFSFFFPSKLEVQARVRMCRSFFCRINLLLPFSFFRLSLSSSLLLWLFFLLTHCLFCISINIISPRLRSLSHQYSLLFTHISILQHISPWEAKVKQCVDLILDCKHQDVNWDLSWALYPSQKFSFKAQFESLPTWMDKPAKSKEIDRYTKKRESI